MIKDYKVYLDDVVTAISDIEDYTKGMTFEQFEEDTKTFHAVSRCLEIIGEAIKRLPMNIREHHPEIAWKSAAGMRDKLIQAYDDVDLDIIWDTIINVMPPFKKQVQKLLEEN